MTPRHHKSLIALVTILCIVGLGCKSRVGSTPDASEPIEEQMTHAPATSEPVAAEVPQPTDPSPSLAAATVGAALPSPTPVVVPSDVPSTTPVRDDTASAPMREDGSVPTREGGRCVVSLAPLEPVSIRAIAETRPDSITIPTTGLDEDIVQSLAHSIRKERSIEGLKLTLGDLAYDVRIIDQGTDALGYLYLSGDLVGDARGIASFGIGEVDIAGGIHKVFFRGTIHPVDPDSDIDINITFEKDGASAITIFQPMPFDCGVGSTSDTSSIDRDSSRSIPVAAEVPQPADPAPSLAAARVGAALPSPTPVVPSTTPARDESMLAPMPGGEFDFSIPPGGSWERSLRGYNVLANRDSFEPYHHPEGMKGNVGGVSVWYSATPTGNGLLTLDTEGSEINTILAAYVADDPTDYFTFHRIAANDDAPDLGLQSRIAWHVEPGTRYLIVVDGYDGEQGKFVLSARFEAMETTPSHTPLPKLPPSPTFAPTGPFPPHEDGRYVISFAPLEPVSIRAIVASQPDFISVPLGGLDLNVVHSLAHAIRTGQTIDRVKVVVGDFEYEVRITSKGTDGLGYNYMHGELVGDARGGPTLVVDDGYFSAGILSYDGDVDIRIRGKNDGTGVIDIGRPMPVMCGTE